MEKRKAWIVKGWKEFNQWAHAHPYHLGLSTAVAVFVGGLVGCLDLWKTGVAVLVVYLIPSAIVQHRQSKKLITAALIFLVASNGYGQALLPVEPQAFLPGLIEQVTQGELDAAAIKCYLITIVIIIAVASVIIYTLIRESERVPPPPPPDEEGSYEDADAGSFVQVPQREFQYCQTLSAASGGTPTVVELDIDIEATDLGPAARLRIGKTYTDETRLTDRQGLKESLTKWGLDFDPNARGARYAHNGQQVNAWESPIGFIESPSGVIPTFSRGGVPYPMILEQSEDLRQWEFLFETRIEAGSTVRIVDTSPTRQRFYRLRTAIPQ